MENKTKHLLFLALLIYSNLFADLGSCVVYEAKYYLKDGSSFNGMIEVMGDGHASYLDKNGKNKYTSDAGMWKLLKILSSKDYYYNTADGGMNTKENFQKITFYRSLIELPIKEIERFSKRHYRSVYGFVEKKNILFKGLDEIENIVFWNARYAKREWLTSEVIITCSETIETVKNSHYWNRVSVSADEDHILFSDDYSEGLDLINYNSKINLAELKRLAKLKLSSLFFNDDLDDYIIKKYSLKNEGMDQNEWSRVYREYFERYLQELKEWFWKRKILLVDIWGTC